MVLRLAVAAALLGAAPAAAQTADVPYTGGRPHDTVTTRERTGVRTTTFRAAVRREGRRLVVRVDALAGTRDGTTKVAQLRVGRCDGLNAYRPCRPDAVRRVVLRPAAGRLALTARIPVPRRGGAVRVSLVPPGRRTEHAYLHLREAAWTALRGRFLGLSGPADPTGIDLRTVRVDAVGITTQRARPTLGWNLTLDQPSDVRTVTSTCAGGRGCVRDETTTVRGAGEYFARPSLQRGELVTMRVRTPGATLFTVRLPFPEKDV